MIHNWQTEDLGTFADFLNGVADSYVDPEFYFYGWRLLDQLVTEPELEREGKPLVFGTLEIGPSQITRTYRKWAHRAESPYRRARVDLDLYMPRIDRQVWEPIHRSIVQALVSPGLSGYTVDPQEFEGPILPSGVVTPVTRFGNFTPVGASFFYTTAQW